jgi:hypothetical protein
MRKHRTLLIVYTIGLISLAGGPAFSQKAAEPANANEQAPTYRPPQRGAPASRVGGGSRGISEASAQVSAIAPDHTGLTRYEQPTLYWYVSGPVSAPIEITLIDDISVKPLIVYSLPKGIAEGLHEIKISDSNVRLKTGIEYRWHVALVLDPDQRSKDVIASATIRRATLPEDVLSRLDRNQGRAAVRAYAEQGLWYDAIDVLAKQFRHDPANTLLRRDFQSLLMQVGLDQFAALK